MEGEELQEIKELVQENNKILRGLRRSARIGRTLSVLWWLLIIGASVGALYFLQPYIERLLATYDSFRTLLPQ